MSEEVIVIKTLQGVDYIGKVKEETDMFYVLEDVFATGVYDNEGEVGVQLGMVVHPALGKVDKDKNGAAKRITLNKVATVFSYEPEKQLVDHYHDAVSCIQVARSMPGNM